VTSAPSVQTFKGKVVPMLNQLPRYEHISSDKSTPCREEVWDSGGIAARILNLGTKWR